MAFFVSHASQDIEKALFWYQNRTLWTIFSLVRMIQAYNIYILMDNWHRYASLLVLVDQYSVSFDQLLSTASAETVFGSSLAWEEINILSKE